VDEQPTGTWASAHPTIVRRHVAILLVVVMATGMIDAVSLLTLHVFTAYVTGSMILFGTHLAGVPGSVWPSAVAIVSFALGALLGARLVKRPLGTHRLHGDVLVVDALLVLGAAIAAARGGSDGDLDSYAIITALALAMGLQLAMIQHARVTDVALPAATVITYKLVADSPLAGGRPTRTVRRVGVVVSLVAGATLGALVARWEPWAAWALAAALLALAAVLSYTLLPRSDPDA
jgi:uncharacterized membrane protein YoaK (UPF0700 family)